MVVSEDADNPTTHPLTPTNTPLYGSTPGLGSLLPRSREGGLQTTGPPLEDATREFGGGNNPTPHQAPHNHALPPYRIPEHERKNILATNRRTRRPNKHSILPQTKSNQLQRQRTPRIISWSSLCTGRALILKTRWHNNEELTILNIYAPNNPAEHQNTRRLQSNRRPARQSPRTNRQRSSNRRS